MATPADQRLLELLDKWLKSLELHAKYSSLDDQSYWKIQPWVEHQRPSRWIVDLATQKTLALRTQIEERMKMGDAKYSDSLELMIFLANLVGSEHIERFIPLAEAHNERSLHDAAPDETTADEAAPDQTREQPAPAQAAARRAVADDAPTDNAMLLHTTPVPTIAVTATREMPQFVATKHTPPPAGTAHLARTERRAHPRPAAKPTPKHHPPRLGATAKPAPVLKPAPAMKPAVKPVSKVAPAAPADRSGPSEAACAQVIADAARLVQWGRKWYELPELIARMADRPSLPEVRRILKENKSAIDAKVGAPSP